MAKIWLAAHRERKLKKSQVIHTDLVTSVKNIMNPSEPLALRLSAQLLLGVVRIQVQKTQYLYKDSSETVIKIRMGPLGSLTKRQRVHEPLQPRITKDRPKNATENVKTGANWLEGLEPSSSNSKFNSEMANWFENSI